MKRRWFKRTMNPGEAWEWNPETRVGTWVSLETGHFVGTSGLKISDFETLFVSEEIYPVWADPDLHLQEGL